MKRILVIIVKHLNVAVSVVSQSCASIMQPPFSTMTPSSGTSCIFTYCNEAVRNQSRHNVIYTNTNCESLTQHISHGNVFLKGGTVHYLLITS